MTSIAIDRLYTAGMHDLPTLASSSRSVRIRHRFDVWDRSLTCPLSTTVIGVASGIIFIVSGEANSTTYFVSSAVMSLTPVDANNSR